MPNEQEYSIGELADLAGVTPRTIRYYVSIGLLPSPEQAGPKTRYTDGHLKRLRLIRHLQRGHLPLGEIGDRLGGLDDEAVEAALDADAGPAPDSALEYINQLQETTPKEFRATAQKNVDTGSPDPGVLAGTRTRWERVPLGENVELHIRLPQGRHKQKQIERLIALGRELLDEGDQR
jgi:DNA-binding transcriptional MerR regulator